MDAWKDADLPINGEEVGTAELFWLGTSGMKFRESIIKLMIFQTVGWKYSSSTER
jgi:hypothetical protein